jgi:Sigma 54 modulation/S30EA ribosomal protein C terminus
MQGGAGRAIPRRPAYDHAEHPASPARLGPRLPVSIVADPELGERERQQALELISRLEHWAPRPVLHARVTLRQLPDPALERPAIAKATLDVSGRPVRAHVAAETIDQALGRLEERLRRNLEDLEETRRADRHQTGTAEAGEWRHGNLPAARPEYFDRPIEGRELVRRKTYGLSALTPEQAVIDMDALDHDFHLFTNVDTGEESVVYRRPTGDFGLLCVHPREAQHAGAPLLPDLSPAPVLVLEDAIERLNVSGERFVFYVDAQTRRGNVLYRRYDGHYGLLELVGSGGGDLS